ncbi:MAG: FHA domain-containing protein [Myxococcales bacterium]|nr:FHA domain-containing protein [Myxococcales bacterium]
MNKKAMTVRGQDSDNSPAEAHLWVCSGKNVGRRYTVGAVPKVLGRAVACDIVVEDERASQRHARIHFAQGKHVVGDLSSTNGTFVNSHRIQQAELRDGDLVQIGETVFEYLFEGAGANPPHPNDRVNRGRPGTGSPRQPTAGNLVPAGAPPAMPSELAPPGYHHGYAPGAQLPAPYAGHYGGQYYAEEEPAEATFDLISYLIWIRKIIQAYAPYWPVIASFLFIGVALGALYHKYTPAPYSAAFQIVLRPSGTSRSVLGGPNGGDGTIEFFGNQVATRFTSAPVIEQTLKRVTGDTPSSPEVSITAANLTFERLGNFQSNMYSGSIKAQDGDYAVRYLNTHLQVFLNREVEMALSQVKADVGFFRKQVEETARLVDKAESAVSKYKATHPDALPELARTNYNLLFTLQQRRSELERKLVSLEASLREDNLQFKQTPKYSKASISQRNTFAVRISETESKLAAARAQGKGNKHPEVLQLRRELAEYKQLSNARNDNKRSNTTQVTLNPTYQRLEQRVQEGTAEYRALKQELKQVNGDLQSQKRKIELLPQAEAEYRELAQEYETGQAAYSELLKHLKNAELHLDRERARADSQYNIVMPPRQSLRNPNKSRFIRLLMGGFVGVFFAFALSTILSIRSGHLSLSLLIGREIDLSAIFGDDEPPPEPSRSHRPALMQPNYYSGEDEPETLAPPHHGSYRSSHGEDDQATIVPPPSKDSI